VLSLPDDRSVAGFQNLALHSKLDDGQSQKKENDVSELNSV
jgi:hypothetical protein